MAAKSASRRDTAAVASSPREIVERAYAAFNAGDLDGFMAVVDADAEWHWPPGVADTDVYHGAAEIARGIGLWTESWVDFRMDPEEVLERGDRVFLAVRYEGRSRASGLAIDQTVAHLWELRGPRAVRVRMFGDVDKARRRFLE
jgi:ketosteroid isomerase-like protein